MILLVELLVALGVVAALGAFLTFAWYLIPVVLVVQAVRAYRRQAAIKQHKADLQAGRVKPTRVQRCRECAEALIPCDACVQRFQETEAT